MASAGHTQESSRDRAAADAQRLRLGASPPERKFTRSCSSSISGILENHSTRPAPGFTSNDLVPVPADVVVLWGLLAPLPVGGGGRHTASTRGPPSRGTASARGPKTPKPHSAPGDSPFLPARLQVSSCRVADAVLPLFMESSWNLNPLLSPFSLFSSVPATVSTLPLSLQLLFYTLPHLHPLSANKNSSLPSMASLSPSSMLCTVVPAEFCGLGCAHCCVNPQIIF